MQRPAPFQLVLLTALLCFAGITSHATLASETASSGKDLKKLRVAGKVEAVLWTRRNDAYTLQVIFPNPGRIAYFMKQNGAPSTGPRVQVWLLNANGAIIGPKQIPSSDHADRQKEATFSYALTTGQEAVAVALMIDDEYCIESLTD